MRFNYAGNWTINTLDEICDFYKGNGLSKSDLSSEGRPCILYGELYTSYKKEIIDSIISKTDTMLSKPFISKKNDVIIPGSGEDPIDIAVARAIENDGIILGGDLNVLRLHPKYSGAFLSYQLNGKRRYEIAKKAQGKSIVHLHNSDLKDIKVFMPQYDEQLKIINLLKHIDKRIELQNKIIEVKRLLKDLIIDNCIFKSNDCEYVEVCNFADLKNGYAFKSNNYTDCGKYKVITIGNVSGERYLNLNKLNYLTYIPLDIQKHQILKKGDLLISLTGNVGRISICNEENCLLNQRVGLIELFNVNDYEYLYQVMASKRFQNDMVLRAQGAAQPNIGKDDVLNYSIPYLNNLNKRKKISSVLRLLDNSILSDENLLITYNKQKQYLLRNLFI